MLRDIKEQNYTVAYNDLVHFGEIYCDDSTLMLWNLLMKMGIKEILVAGFDGHKDGKLNFYDNALDRNKKDVSTGEKVKEIIKVTFSTMNVTFLTDSEYNR